MPTQVSSLAVASPVESLAAGAAGGLAPTVGLLEALEGWPILALFAVVSAAVFGAIYTLVERKDIGQAHAVAAGIGGVASVFLILVVLQLLYRVY